MTSNPDEINEIGPAAGLGRAGTPDAAERLLEALCAEDHALADLARGLGMPLADLARLAGERASAALFDGLLRLAEARAAMAVCRYRGIAAAVLVNIAAQKDSDQRHGDLQRKACVDLLNLELPMRGNESAGIAGAGTSAGAAWREGEAGRSLDGPPAATAPAILAAFDRLERQEAQAMDQLKRSMDEHAPRGTSSG
jgi:hypothetical protein